uniref:Uncharacterized protein n=1 Tax=Lepeophtheirus salmonis TaxID=72036 RepID=A0A0K2TEC3_LEPSM
MTHFLSLFLFSLPPSHSLSLSFPGENAEVALLRNRVPMTRYDFYCHAKPPYHTYN